VSRPIPTPAFDAAELPFDRAALLTAVRRLPGFADLDEADLQVLPQRGISHVHVGITRPAADGARRLLRLPRISQLDMPAADNLAYQAAGFARAAVSGHTPRVHATIAPGDGLPMGALLVDWIDGRLPRLPDDLPKLAEALAAIHGLPVPPPAERAPLANPADPVRATLAIVQRHAQHLHVAPAATRAAIESEIAAVADWAESIADRDQPITLVGTDTHPGNYLIAGDAKEQGRHAVFVDLEKAAYGNPAIDLAHASLYPSATWDPDCGAALDDADVVAFYRAYLTRIDSDLAARLRPWLLPLRRLTWLRTLTFFARWRAEADGGGAWAPAGVDPALLQHFLRRIEACFDPQAIAAMRAEWLDRRLEGML
jgi:aminoglycoside phosphotransferase (APT) family kinase protein